MCVCVGMCVGVYTCVHYDVIVMQELQRQYSPIVHMTMCGCHTSAKVHTAAQVGG